nr:uncharacterized mitochondrial protein AtMg00810-like [Tanacetum cinerariifolium]
MCLIKQVNDVNVCNKAKYKRNKKRKEWKPTGKVFIKIRYSWKSIGRNFNINGNRFPLTRITSTKLVPPKESTIAQVVTPTQGILVYNRRPKASRSVGSSSKVKNVESNTPNTTKPNRSWGSTISDVPFSSLIDCRFENDHIAKIIGYKDYQMGNITISQNDVAKRWNCTLVEAARTMLIFSKALLFLWAKAVATACYTQNRSLIRKHHNKTPYELLHDRKPDLSYLHVFGALCYPTNDSEDLGLQISQSPGGIFLNQSKCALESIKKYGMETCKPADTLMVEKSKLDEDPQGKAVDPTHYHRMIGTLMYLTASRPDLVFVVRMCAWYQAKPTKSTYMQLNIPKIFMQQFWYTIKKVQGTDSYELLLANKKSTVNAKVFRTILDMCPKVEGVYFTNVPDDDIALTFLIDLGYKDVALELGISISLTEATEDKAVRQFNATHARIMTESEPEHAKEKIGSRSTRGVVIQDLPSASKPKPDTRGPDEEKVTSEEKVILEWGSKQEIECLEEDQGDDEEVDWIGSDKDEEKKEDTDDDKSIDLEMTDDEETDDEFVHDDEQVNEDEDEEMTNAKVEDSRKGDANISDMAKVDAKKIEEIKDDAKKAELPPTSSSLSTVPVLVISEPSILTQVQETPSVAPVTTLPPPSVSAILLVPHKTTTPIPTPPITRLRVLKLEKDVSELKKFDLSAEALSTLKSYVPTVVDNYLGSKLGDALQKSLHKHYV